MKNQNPDTNRRDFLKLGSAAVATTAVSWSATSYAAIVGANDRVRVGVVGCGDRMKGGDIPAFLANGQGHELRARRRLRHLEPPPRRGRRATIEKLCGKQDRHRPQQRRALRPQGYRRRPHRHCRLPARAHGIEAVKAGRDAYVEKPTAHRMDDARNFLKAVEGSKQVIAVGTQRRSTPAT